MDNSLEDTHLESVKWQGERDNERSEGGSGHQVEAEGPRKEFVEVVTTDSILWYDGRVKRKRAVEVGKEGRIEPDFHNI